jgi:hypothetical protein
MKKTLLMLLWSGALSLIALEASASVLEMTCSSPQREFCHPRHWGTHQRFQPYSNFGFVSQFNTAVVTPINPLPSPTVYHPNVFVTSSNVAYTYDPYGNIARMTTTIFYSDGHMETKITDTSGNPI